MSRADQLRQALDIIDAERAHEQISGYVTEESPIIDAARCWLRLQEADEQIIEQVAFQFVRFLYEGAHPNMAQEVIVREAREYARTVLAAISEGSGE